MVLAMPVVLPDADEAWRLQRKTVELAPEARRAYEDHFTRIFVAGVLARAALPDSARTVLLGARAGGDVDPYMELPFYEARIWTVLGEEDEAVDRLHTFMSGFSRRGGGESADWALHWWWRGLQDHPGFQELVRLSQES